MRSWQTVVLFTLAITGVAGAPAPQESEAPDSDVPTSAAAAPIAETSTAASGANVGTQSGAVAAGQGGSIATPADNDTPQGNAGALPQTVPIGSGAAPPVTTPDIVNIAFGNGVANSSIAPTVNAPQPNGDVNSVAEGLANNAEPITIPGGGPAAKGPIYGSEPGEYLYVWSGAEGRRTEDRLVTLDFNRDSPTYGQVVAVAGVGTAGNEPHHCGLSKDKTRLLCGGFFSVLQRPRQDDIFVFDMTTPARPRFLRSNRGINGAVQDDFIPLNDNTFILSEMGSNRGNTPGRIAKVDSNGNILGEYPRRFEPIPRGYNPHGVAVREDLNLFVSSDFLAPETGLNSYPGDPVLRNTIRVWDLAAMRIRYSFTLPTGTGTMDTKLFHLNPDGMGYVGGTGNGQIWAFNSATRHAKRVIDLTRQIVPPWFRSLFPVDSQMMQISPDDTRFYIPYASKNDKYTGKSGFYSGIAVFDVTDPWNPLMIQNARMPMYAGPHLGQLYGDRFVTAGYFVDMDNFGKLHLNGDHVVRVLQVNDDGTLTEDLNFQVDFDRILPGVQLRPHGLSTIKM